MAPCEISLRMQQEREKSLKRCPVKDNRDTCCRCVLLGHVTSALVTDNSDSCCGIILQRKLVPRPQQTHIQQKHVQKERNAAHLVAEEGQERCHVHLNLAGEQTRTAVLLTDITNALDGQCALDPHSAFMDSSCGPKCKPRSRQWHPRGGVASEDGSCDTVADLMTMLDKTSLENVRTLVTHACCCSCEGDHTL